MSKIAQDVFDLTMDLLRKRAASGLIDAQKTAGYRAAAPGLLTIWQNENAKLGNLYATAEFSNHPVDNLFGDRAELDIVEYEGSEDLIRTCATSCCRAYYFEVDGPGTVYVEDYTDRWNVLKEIPVPPSVERFTAYKGSVTPTPGATQCRLRFSGGTYYRTVNRALFGIPFYAGREPAYRPWVKMEMPEDFFGWDKIVEESGEGDYNPQAHTKREGRKDFYISYWYEGSIRIVYVPAPPAVNALADTILVDDVMALSGAYFLAQHLMLTEDPDSANFFGQRYEEYRGTTVSKPPASEAPIIDVYGGLTG